MPPARILLRHSTDPRLRSFIVNGLGPLGADPKSIAAELDQLNSPAAAGTERVVPPATGKMDAILFYPETSIRRAVILAVGTYGTTGLSLGETSKHSRQSSCPPTLSRPGMRQ